MAAIKWDASGERYFETGVSKGVLYVQKATRGENDDSAYETGVAWNGLTSVSESPDGAEPNDLYADNIKYASLRSAETFGATIEAYTYPDEFAQCDGSFIAGGGGIYIGQQARKPFGFCYRTEVGSDTVAFDSDDLYKLHIIYNATVSPSDRSYETVNDSPDAITFSWEMTTTPVNFSNQIDGHTMKPTSTIVIDKSKLDATHKGYLEVLEKKLYGTDASGSTEATDPILPDPDAVISIMTTGA